MSDPALHLKTAAALLHVMTTPGSLDALLKAVAGIEQREKKNDYMKVALEAGRTELMLLHLCRAIGSFLRDTGGFDTSTQPAPDEQTRPPRSRFAEEDLRCLTNIASTAQSIADSFHLLMIACTRASLAHRKISAACVHTAGVIKREKSRLLSSGENIFGLPSSLWREKTFVDEQGRLIRIDQEVP